MSQKFVQAKKTKLSGSGVTATATSIGLNFFTTPDDTAITDTDLGTTNYGTLEPGSEKEEIISFTGVTQNVDGTATLTGVTRGLKFVSDYTADTGLRQAHAGGTVFVVSNNPQMYEDMVSGANDETITGEYIFPEGGDAKAPKSGTSYSAPTDDLEYASKKYADDLAIAGSPDMTTTVKGIAEEATEAEIDADTGAGGTSARLAINPSTLATSKYGVRLPTADEKAALAGTSGTPSSSNKYVTDDDVADDGTASKVVRADASSQVTVNETPTADGHAASKKYVDDNIYTESYTSFLATRVMTAETGSVDYAHGLGTIPKRIKITAYYDSSCGAQNVGTYDGTNINAILLTGNAVATASNSTTNIVYADQGSNKTQAGVPTFDATNISISWTKGAGAGSGSIYMLIEAWA